MGIHTGEPLLGQEGYPGPDVVRAARICSAAHGGQVLVLETTRALAGEREFRDLGSHGLKGLEGQTRLHQLLIPGLPSDFDPPRTEAPALHSRSPVAPTRSRAARKRRSVTCRAHRRHGRTIPARHVAGLSSSTFPRHPRATTGPRD